MKEKNLMEEIFREIKTIRMELKKEKDKLQEDKDAVKIRKENIMRLEVLLEEKLDAVEKGMVQTSLNV